MEVLALVLGVVRGGTRRSTWAAGSCKEHVQDISPGVVQGIERQVAPEPESCAVFEVSGQFGLLTCVCDISLHRERVAPVVRAKNK